MTRLNDPIEIELKLEVAEPDVEGLLRSALWSGHPVRVLTSTYFDTPDHQLRRSGLSLRLRAGVQTLKVNAQNRSGLFERAEWEHPVSGSQPDLAPLASTPLGALGVTPQQLQPVVRIVAERRTALVTPNASSVIEAALDIGQVQAGGHESTFCELELEKIKGSTGDLFHLALSLTGQTRLQPSSQSKADRGFALLAPEPAAPVKAESRSDLSGLRVGEALTVIVREGLGQVLHNGAIVAQDRNAEALHQIRVALRRLRSALGLFKSVVEDPAFADLRNDLRALSQTMGKARDLDVLIARIEAAPLPSPRLLEALINDRGQAYDAVCRALTSHAYSRLILTVMGWAEAGDWREAHWPQAPLRDQPAHLFADKALERLRRKLKAQGDGLAVMAAAEQHMVRIRAKHLRYAMEVFASLYPDSARPCKHLVEAVKQVQDLLGSMNDRAVGETLLRAHSEGPAAFDAGQALVHLYGAQDDAPVQAESALKAAMDLPRFWNRP